jgi:hydroxypyruvate reductase
VTRELQLAGADIRELNCVRKHLDQLKGGRLARIAAPAPILALVLSDVVGDPCDAIASGPVSPDPTTYADALDVLKRHGLWLRAPGGVRQHLQAGLEGNVEDSPRPDDACFANVRTSIVGNARTAGPTCPRDPGGERGTEDAGVPGRSW